MGGPGGAWGPVPEGTASFMHARQPCRRHDTPLTHQKHLPPPQPQLHGIHDADVAACPTFAAVADEWADWLRGCDLHGYNARRMDVPMLQ